MIREGKSQSILVSGESGSGKTETTKYLLQFFAAMGSSKNLNLRNINSETQDKLSLLKSIERKVLESTPLLEAFGNARTQRNDNSSRFGKFIDIRFHSQFGIITGALIHTYLLEKSRVVSQIQKERGYHIFYQMLEGLSPEEREKLELLAPRDYEFLKKSGCFTLKEVSDSEQFQKTKTALEVIGIDQPEQFVIFSILSGILLLGNISFKENPKSADASHIVNPSILQNGSKLLGLNATALEKALLTRYFLLFFFLDLI